MRSIKKLRAKENGQMILEYVIMFVAIVSVILLAVPFFYRPAMNQYYEYAVGPMMNAAVNGMVQLGEDISSRFSRTWSDYTFDGRSNIPLTIPSYAAMTSGRAEMRAIAEAENARIRALMPSTGGGGDFGGGSGWGWD